MTTRVVLRVAMPKRVKRVARVNKRALAKRQAKRLQNQDQFPARVREGPGLVRLSTPVRDTTLLRVVTVDKMEMEDMRMRFSRPGRIRPHWEMFALLLASARERNARWWERRLRRWDREMQGTDGNLDDEA